MAAAEQCIDESYGLSTSLELRILFLGSSEFSLTVLQALHQCSGFRIVGVVTQPDRPRGRGQRMCPTPVKEYASAFGIPVFTPEKASDPNFLSAVRQLQVDLAVVAAYGLILPAELIYLPRFWTLNVHASLLPRYRGAAPVERAIFAGEKVTGVTIMLVSEGLDAGPILTQERVVIEPEDNACTLTERLARTGAALLLKTIKPYISGLIKPVPQDDRVVSYAPKIRDEEGWIRWERPALYIERQVRAFTPKPGAVAALPEISRPRVKITRARIDTLTDGVAESSAEPGTVLKVGPHGILVQCGEGRIWLLELQREGGRVLSWQSFAAGLRIRSGYRFLSWQG